MANKIKKFKRNFGHRKKTKKASGPQEVSSQQSTLQKALILHQAGRLRQAEDLYRQILLAEPDHPDALHYLGILAHQEGKSEAAIELINKALSLKPDYAEARYNIGIVQHALGRQEEAISSFHQAITLKPNYAEAHNKLGNLLKEKGKLDEAVACYRRALTLKPELAEPHYNVGIELQAQGKFDEAVASYRRALTLKPDYAGAHLNLGNVLQTQGRLEEAVVSYRRALTLKPDYAGAHLNLGNVLQTQGKLDEAVASYRRALSLKPDFVEVLNNLGNVLNDQGKLDEAIACYRQALNIKPSYIEVHRNLAMIFKELGKMDEAIACYRKVLSLKPDYVMAYAGLSSIVKFTEVDDVIDGMENLYNKKENMSDEDLISLGFALGKVYEDLKQYDKSFRYIAEANQLKRKSYEYSIQTDLDLFERIKKTFSHDFFSSHDGSGAQDRTPIFIVGMLRSGTTLVEQILASHPDVYGAGELKILANLTTHACTGVKAAPFPECILDLDMGIFERMGLEYIAKIREYSNDAKYITDKMPHNFLHVGLIKTILPNAKIIHCKRNPMDNCFSIFKNNFTESHEYAYNMVELGRYYNLYRELMAYWERVQPEFMYTLKYEEMVSDQRNQTKQLLAFCGLPWSEACLAFHKTERKVSTASVVQIRQPIYKDSVKLWKRYEKQLEPLRKAIYG